MPTTNTAKEEDVPVPRNHLDSDEIVRKVTAAIEAGNAVAMDPRSHTMAKIAKWVGGVVVGVFLAGVTYKELSDSNALKSDVDAKINPVAEQVVQNSEAIETLAKGLDFITCDRHRQFEIDALERDLARERNKYQEKVQNYIANGRRGKKPQPPLSLNEAEEELDTYLRRSPACSKN